MKILVDECCPPDVVAILRQDQHDVVYIAEETAGALDADILNRSVAEQQIIVTEDRDFCELVFRDAKPTYGIVLVRIDHQFRHEKPERIRFLFATYADELLHAMTTLTRTHGRIRPLTATNSDEETKS